MKDTELDELLRIARQVATSAGEVVSKSALEHREVLATKSSSVDVVTVTDRASEEHIVATITGLRPQDGILGEEGAAVEGESGVRWVVDPIDGTVNFLYGIPNYSVSVGAEYEGHAVVGAVFNPVTGDLFSARLGGGAFLNTTPIAVRPAPPLERSLVATGFGYESERRAQQADVLTRLLPKVRDIRRFGGAALDLCGVACGRVDAYYEQGIKRWDICAGSVIAAEAGARVSTISGKPDDGSVVACHPALMSELRRAIA